MHGNIYKERLEELRGVMRTRKLDGFLVPRADRYPGEFVSPAAERLAWLTGFTGSAGTAVVLSDVAAIFTDGRYTIQLAAQADVALYKTYDMAQMKISAWIAQEMKAGQVIGFDPWLYTPEQVEVLRTALALSSITLQAVEYGGGGFFKEAVTSVDLQPVEIFPDSIAGRGAAEKRAAAAEILKEAGAHGFVMAMPDSIAWLLNIRGLDVEHTPVVLSHAVLFADGRMIWLVDPARVSDAVRKAIGGDIEIVHPYETRAVIVRLAQEAKAHGQKVAFDYARTPVWFKDVLEQAGAEIIKIKDPCILPKAIKTPSEQASIRDVHIKDGVAMVRFLSWFDHTARKQHLHELDVVEKLEAFRALEPSYRGPSFSTISGFGSNGAIVHYRATEETNLPITSPGVLLLDSGGQYAGGTTDITRTISIGAVSDEVKKNFTLVLKGHIALAAAVFAKDTTGAQLDEIARHPLMREGLNYSHGTGHGVGCYLSVHEEASNISPRGKDALMPGMLLSNEPGYYKEGAYGIRIENLVMAQMQGEMLAFETVTLTPIDLRMIDVARLTGAECDWLNAYHARVRATLSPLLEPEVQAWLVQATAPLP